MISSQILYILARSGRIEIIRTLKAFPECDFSITKLAKVAKVPTMTAWRCVMDLKKAGLVKTRRVGNVTSVRITDDKDQLRMLRLVPETDPQRVAAKIFAERLGNSNWLRECRLFGSIGRGEHSPGDEVDIAIVYAEGEKDDTVKNLSLSLAEQIKAETNVSIVPFLIAENEMARRGGIASELRDREVIWKRSNEVTR